MNVNLSEKIILRLAEEGDLPDSELLALIGSGEFDGLLFRLADLKRRERYGDEVFVRGLIEFSNYCRNDCYYCGIRRSNGSAERYRLTKEEIMECAASGYGLGYRTFVLQSGEDPYYTDDRICEIVAALRAAHPDCAITLSIGEKPKESYRAYFEAGANRYLLRHETADSGHYGKLHPASMSPDNRKRCLFDLKEIGYQVGAGFMVGTPGQTAENLVSDFRFMQELRPDMIGIGPFMTHSQTPFAGCPNGSFPLTLRLLAVTRLMFPYALIPATTALGTIHPLGREQGLKAGCNVVMPNLSPVRFRKKYELYDNKICTGEESAECRSCLEARVAAAGYRVVTDVGDVRRDPGAAGR